MSFSTIPVRTNGPKVEAGWFNALRTAGILVDSLVAQTTFTVANNQSSPANVTGAAFAQASYRGVILLVEGRRKTDSSERVAMGFIFMFYRQASSTWDVMRVMNGDELGIEFTVTGAGQLQYISDNQSGSNYSGSLRFRAFPFEV